MPERSSQQAGKDAERLALRHLEQQGLRLLAQNWSCKRGELDLVMLDGDTVVFVEVCYRINLHDCNFADEQPELVHRPE